MEAGQTVNAKGFEAQMATIESDRFDADSPSGAAPLSLRHSVGKIGKLSSIYILGSAVPPVIAMLLLPVFTRYLPREQMGIVTLSQRIAGLLAILVTLCLGSGLRMQYFHFDAQKRPQLLRTALIGQLGISFVFCLVLSLAGVWCAEWALPNLAPKLLDARYVYYLWLMVVWGCFLTTMIDLTVGTEQLMEHAATSVFLGFLNYICQVGLGIAAVVLLGWQGFGRYGTIVLGMLIAALVSVAVMWRCGRGGFHAGIFRRVAGMGLTFIPHNLANNVQYTLNAWLLAWWLNPGAVGVYGIAVAFAQLLDMPVISLMNAAFPTLARLMSDGSPESRRQQARLYTLLAVGVVGLSLGSLLFSPVAIRILTAPGYHEAANVVVILILAWLFQGFYSLVLQPAFYFGADWQSRSLRFRR